MDPGRDPVCPQQTVLDLDARDRTELLRAVATLLSRLCAVGAQPIFRALQRREQAGSTAVGHALAIPHARMPGLDAPLTLFARTRSPIRFAALDTLAVSEFFVILVPAEGAAEAHLQLLARVAELFSMPAFRAALSVATTPAAVAEAFARWAHPGGEDEPEALQGLS